MTKKQKILEKMEANPRDWRIEQLEKVASDYGVSVRKSGGSHVVFDHPEWIVLLCIPAHRPIKPFYVKKLISLLSLLEKKI
jgi:predicted RNA binding protein YcfA (HicA-like mRNA interferase family)